MNTSSVVGLFSTASEESKLVHFDYERNKDAGYPEAHTQVIAQSEYWDWVLPQGRSLGQLHLPVGPRRFRTALEDIIEFLVVEKLVNAHYGWSPALQESRDAFRKLQLRAAVRRDPESAIEILDDMGYRITPPSPR